ncbi:MAG: DUF202 domain-containing protein [Leptospirales bacterium]
MRRIRYSKRETKESMRISDYLSVDRTIMANERTLLAYIRTSVGLLIAGLVLIRFFHQTHFDVYQVCGFLALLVALSIMIFGIRDFMHMRGVYKDLVDHDKKTGGNEHPADDAL